MGTENSNRVEAELQKWKQKEERLQQIFSTNMSKGLRREQLRDYDRIVAKYKNTKDPEERSTLRMLRQERKRIEREAYPNGIVRWFRKLFVNPVRRYNLARKHRKLEQSNRNRILDQLNKVGMGEHYSKIEKRMQNGERSFSVPTSHYVNENERIDHLLAFEQNTSGEYNMVSNKTQLKNEADPKLSRQQEFKLGDGTTVDSRESYNLLHGRAIRKDGKWIMLDLNDRDTQGNFRVKEFSRTFGFDAEKSLQDLPIVEMKNRSSREKIIDDLNKGERTKVTIGGKTYYAETNPQFKTINIYDENSQKVSKDSLLGKRSAQEKRINQDFKTRIARKNGIRI